MSNYQTIEAAACDALADLGLAEPKHFKFDRWQVVAGIGDKPGANAGRVKIFADGLGGICTNWRTGESKPFFLNREGQSQPLSDAERQRIEQQRQQRRAEEMAARDRAAKRAVALWKSAKPAPADHPYLIEKQILPHLARVACWRRKIDGQPFAIDNALLVPLFDESGALRSLQAIFPAKHPVLKRNKDFLPGGGLAGLFCWIGKRTDKVLLCEGFATGATLHEQTGHRVYLAFSSTNLLAVAQIIRAKLPSAAIVICADNDTNTPGNPGLTKASEAADAVGAALAVPPIAGDFNDYAAYLRQGGGHG